MHNEHRTPIELSEQPIDAYTSALSGSGATARDYLLAVAIGVLMALALVNWWTT
jgi:hypothetical protein